MLSALSIGVALANFYDSAEWRKLRHKVRLKWKHSQRPCAFCGKPIVNGEKTIVDHIQPRRARPDLSLVESNLQLMHWSCHNVKTHKHERLNMAQVNANGFTEGSDWS